MNAIENIIAQQKERELKANKENLAITLSSILGAEVVRKIDYDKVNEEKRLLLKEIENIDILQDKLITAHCKLQAFQEYHSKWKPITRKFENRISKLKSEKLYIEFKKYNQDISDNLREAYNCYLNGLSMSCYIMILRSIELIVNNIYDKYNVEKYKANGHKRFISASQKLNWVQEKGYIGGADFTVAKAFIQARNTSVHEVYTPTEQQILAAFETVTLLLNKLDESF